MNADLINPAWGRLLEIIAHASQQQGREVSPCEFAEQVGIRNARNIYSIKRGDNGITIALALDISRRFPAFSPAWICGFSRKRSVGPFAPLAGKWERIQLYVTTPEKPGGWVASDIDNRGGIGIEFREGGEYFDLEFNHVIQKGYYFFDSANGELQTGFNRHIVSKLTPDELEIIDRTQFLRPVKFHYRRV